MSRSSLNGDAEKPVRAADLAKIVELEIQS